MERLLKNKTTQSLHCSNGCKIFLLDSTSVPCWISCAGWGTWVFCVINNFCDLQRRGRLPRTHTQSGSFIRQIHTCVLTLPPSSGFYLKTQHLEKSNTAAPEIKLLRKLRVTVSLRFMVLGSSSATVGALGLLALAHYWQWLMWVLSALLTPL